MSNPPEIQSRGTHDGQVIHQRKSQPFAPSPSHSKTAGQSSIFQLLRLGANPIRIPNIRMSPKSRLELCHDLSGAPKRVRPINLPAVKLLCRRAGDLLKNRRRFRLRLGCYLGLGLSIPEVLLDRFRNCDPGLRGPEVLLERLGNRS